MDDKLLKRSIVIGSMDFLSLLERKNLIYSDIPLDAVCRHMKSRPDYACMTDSVFRWLDESPLNSIWFADKDDYPVFDPVQKHVPYFIFCRGRRPDIRNRHIAIVGTRHCDYLGLQKSFQLGLEASASCFNVVTGLAEGCDQAAASGCVQLGAGGGCNAVLGCGLDVNYPSMSRKLKEAIIEYNGCLLSKFLPGTPPLRYNFPDRNLIITALSDCIIVTQAPAKSGALITADFALQMGKDVYVSSEGTGTAACRAGTDLLCFDGAGVINHISDIYPKAVAYVKSRNGIRFGSCFYSLNN